MDKDSVIQQQASDNSQISSQTEETDFLIIDSKVSEEASNNNTGSEDNPENPLLASELDELEEQDTRNSSTSDSSDQEQGHVEKLESEESEQETKSSEDWDENILISGQESVELTKSKDWASVLGSSFHVDSVGINSGDGEWSVFDILYAFIAGEFDNELSAVFLNIDFIEWVSDNQSGLGIILVNKGKGWWSKGDVVAFILGISQGGPDLSSGFTGWGVWGSKGSSKGEIIDAFFVWGFDDSLGEETEVEDSCVVDEDRATGDVEGLGAECGHSEKDSNKE